MRSRLAPLFAAIQVPPALPQLAAVLSLAVLLPLACREEPPARPAGDAGPRPAFTLADLAAASALDARLARLSALAARYHAELAAAPSSHPEERTARLDPLLDAAAEEVRRALEAMRDPRDRALAAPPVEAARRWPALLREARAERRAGSEGRAARELGAVGAEVARGLAAYRLSRSGWALDAPPEDETAVAFSQARLQLERAEARLGAALPSGPAEPAPALDSARARAEMEVALRRGRAAAAVIASDRRAAAQRWVDAQGRALEALLALAESPPRPAERLFRSLAYQDARAEALAALAEYARLAAERAVR